MSEPQPLGPRPLSAIPDLGIVAPEVSIIVPAFDEERNIPLLVEEIQAAMAWGPSYEILLVDDGSRDSTLEQMRMLARRHPRLRYLSSAENRGQSAALAAGFREARGCTLVTLDADLQNDPADIPQMLEELAEADVVCGIRVERLDGPLRRWSSRIANAVRSAILDDGVHDTGCSLKAYRADFVRHLPPFDGMHRFLPALARMEGARIVEVPVHHRPRRHGTSSYGVHNRLWRGLFDLVGVYWLQRRWVRLGEVHWRPEPPEDLR